MIKPIRLLLRLIKKDYHWFAYKYVKEEPCVVSCKIHGLDYDLDIKKTTQRQMFFDVKYEKYVLSRIMEVLKKDSAVIDIGAHVGFYTLLFAKHTFKSGHVICFEPEYNNFIRLLHNLCKNQFNEYVKAYNLALSYKRGYQSFYINPKNEGGGSLKLFNDYKPLDIIKVKCERLDDILERDRFGKIDIIKIDVEGYELEVLKGMVNTLNKYKPNLFIETWTNEKRDEIRNFLLDYKYDNFEILTPYDTHFS